MLRDLRYALRMMLRAPGFTAVLVLTLALGIGASTTIFSVVNSVLLRPLPYKDPDRLVRVYTAFLGRMQLHDFWVSYPEYEDLKRGCRSCANVAAWARGTASISGGDRPVRVEAAWGTHTLLDTLGARPALGRFFDASEDHPGDPTAVVIGYRVWKTAFAGDPSVLGKTVHVDAMPVTIVGVMPEGFDFPSGIQAWLPSGVDPAKAGRGGHNYSVIARIAPGKTLADLRGELAGLIQGWSAGKDLPNGGQTEHHIGKNSHPMYVTPLHEDTVGSLSTTLWVLQGAVFFVLLIAIVNVANLLLARSEARNREVAVRFALGAKRSRLVRQFLTESVALGLIGGGLGVLVAVWALDGLKALIPASAPRAAEISLDGTALLFALGCTLFASLLFGLAPILHTRQTDVHGSLKDGGPRATGSATRLRIRRALVVGEVALAVVLVVGCTLMVRSFIRLQQVDLGYKPDHLLTFGVEIPQKTYPDAATAYAFFHRIEERVRTLPGVKDATLLSGLPPVRPINANDLALPGRVFDRAKGPVWSTDYWQGVGTHAIETLGARIVRGRNLTPSDNENAPLVVVVNEEFARKFFPGEEPIGQKIKLAGWNEKGEPQTVVGVVANLKQAGIEKPSGTEVLFPIWQYPRIGGDKEDVYRTMNMMIRTEGDPAALIPSVRRVMAELDPTLPMYRTRTMDDVVWEAVARPRFLTLLLTMFSGLALLLAAIGIYGVMSHTVAQRTHEIGIRVALGAQPSQVRRMVLRQGGVLAVIGVLIGAGIAVGVQLLLSTKLRSLVYGSEGQTLPILVGGVVAIVLAVGLIATWLPARRATRVEPTVALREE